jgi:hypothetical protein
MTQSLIWKSAESLKVTPLLGLKTVLGGQILAEKENIGITEGVL